MSATKPKSLGCCFPLFGRPQTRVQEVRNDLVVKHPTQGRFVFPSVVVHAAPPTKPAPNTVILHEQKLLSPDPSLDLSHLSFEEQPQQSPGRLESPRFISDVQKQNVPQRTLEELLCQSADDGYLLLESDRASTQPESTARFRRSDARKPAYYEKFFNTLLTRSLAKVPEHPKSKTLADLTFHKVDTTANEDCDVDVEEDIPFVAPELVSGIKELIARAEIQALKEKKEASFKTPAQMKLGEHFRPFMKAVAELERQTNRGFDWSAIVRQSGGSPRSPRLAASPRLGSPTKLQEFFADAESNPLTRLRTVRRSSIMPVDPVPDYKERATATKLLVQDPLTVRQVHQIHREVITDAKREAQRFAEYLSLDEMSFNS